MKHNENQNLYSIVNNLSTTVMISAILSSITVMHHKYIQKKEIIYRDKNKENLDKKAVLDVVEALK